MTFDEWCYENYGITTIDFFALHRNDIPAGIHLLTDLGFASVNGHFAQFDHFFGFAAGHDARLGQNFLKSYRFIFLLHIVSPFPRLTALNSKEPIRRTVGANGS